MGKTTAAKRTPTKKMAKKTIPVSIKGKEKQAMSKGKARVKFADPMVKSDEEEESLENVDLEEDIEESVEEEDSGEEEESADKGAKESGEEEEDILDDVVKMAAELGSKKKGKNKEKVLEGDSSRTFEPAGPTSGTEEEVARTFGSLSQVGGTSAASVASEVLVEDLSHEPEDEDDPG